MTERQVTVDLLDVDETVLEANLRFVGGSQSYYSEEDTDAGAAGLVLPDLVDGADQVDQDLLLRYKIDGTTDSTARVEQVTAVRKGLTPSDQLITVIGRDWLSEFDDAVIDPPLGVDSKPSATVVRFDWTHPYLDRTGWINPTYLGSLWTADLDQFDDPVGAPLSSKDGAAVEGWPDTFTGWIYSAALDGNDSHPAGTSYFYLSLPGSVAGPFLPISTGDDYSELAFDNVVVDAGVEAPGVQWTEARASGIEAITAGTHHICAKVTNDGRYGTVDNPGAFAFVAYQQVSSAFLEYDNVVARTGLNVASTNPLIGGGWKCLHQPSTAPGFTWGKAYRLMFEAAQDDDHLPDWTLGFTDTNDSNGNPWPVTSEITATVNDTHLDWFRQSHARGFADVGARPGSRVLDAWRWQERGDYWTTPGAPPAWGDSHVSSVAATRKRSGG